MVMTMRTSHTLAVVFIGLMLQLSACAAAPPPESLPVSVPDSATLRVITEPTTASVIIAGQRLQSGERIYLEPGLYDVIVEMEDHHRYREQVVLEPGMHMDRVISLDPLDAEIIINVDPADAEISIGERIVESGSPVALSPGRYRVEISRDGYFPEKISVSLAPGQESALELTLDLIPTSGELRLQGHSADARLLINGREVGVGSAELELEFGRYRFESVLDLADWRRERAERTIVFQRNGEQRFQSATATLEYLHGEDWQSAERFLLEEQEAYVDQRVDNPIHLRAQLSDDASLGLSELEGLGVWLHSLLRPGDRIDLMTESASVLLWARSDQIHPAFAEGVLAFIEQIDFVPPWADDALATDSIEVDLAEPADLIFAVLAARPLSPILSLDSRGLRKEGMEFHRAESDGQVRIVAQGGSGLTMDGSPVNMGPLGLHDEQLESESATHQFAWDEVPERLIVLPANGPHILQPELANLRRGEKSVVSISLDDEPERVHQFTVRLNGDEPGEWESFEPGVGFGSVLDLRDVDLGPHTREGHYQRIWLFEFLSDGSSAQRQVNAEYHVGEEEAETQSGLFLRRRSGSLDSGG